MQVAPLVKFYDGLTVAGLTELATDAISVDQISAVLPSQAVERGDISLCGGGRRVIWWRMGYDMHVLVVERPDPNATAAVAKATVRLPPVTCAAVLAPDDATLCVAATDASAQLHVSRLAIACDPVGGLRILPSREVLRTGPLAPIQGPLCSAAFASLPTGELGVLLCDGASLFAASVTARAAVSWQQIGHDAPIECVAAVAGGCFLTVSSTHQVATYAWGDAATVALDHGRLSVPLGECLTCTARAAGNTTIAIIAGGGCADILTIADGPVAQRRVPSPAANAALVSATVAADGTAICAFAAPLSAVPVSLLAAAGANGSSDGRGTCTHLVTMIPPTAAQQTCVWVGADDEAGRAWFLLDGVAVLAKTDADGTIQAFACPPASTAAAIAATGLIGHARAVPSLGADAALLGAAAADEYVVPVACGAEAAAGDAPVHRVFLEGLRVLAATDSTAHLQFIVHRALLHPARFAFLAEFQHLRVDAAEAGLHVRVCEEDVLAAIEWLTTSEAVPNHATTTRCAIHAAAVADLVGRLAYLAAVLCAWSCADVDVTSPAIARAAGTAAAAFAAGLRVLVELGHNADVAAEDSTCLASSVVNALCSVPDAEPDAALAIAARLAHIDAATGLRAAPTWAAIMRGPVPVVAHFVFASGHVRHASDASAIVPAARAVAAALGRMGPVGAAAALRLMGLGALLPDEAAMAAVAELLELQPAAIPHVYMALAARLLVAADHTTSVHPAMITSALLPAVQVLQRAVTVESAIAMALEDFLHDLSADLYFAQCRAAADDRQYEDALLHVAAALAEAGPVRIDVAAFYVSQIVHRAVSDGGECQALCHVAFEDPVMTTLVAACLHLTAFRTAKPGAPRDIAREPVRIRAGSALVAFLCRRRAFGLAARVAHDMAASLRGAAAVAVAAQAVQFMAQALAALAAIADVHAPPAPTAADVPLGAAPLLQVSLMGRADIPMVQRRLLELEAELSLLRLRRCVDKHVPWGAPGGDQWTQRLVRELVSVRLWPDALRLSELAGLDPLYVLRCRCAELASYDPSVVEDCQDEWKSVIALLSARSSAENDHAPLKAGLSAALSVAHRNVPQALKDALCERSLGAYVGCLLGSGRWTGDEARAAARAKQLPERKLAGSVLVECLRVTLRYLRAVAPGGSLAAEALPPNSFISVPMLERVWALATAVLSTAADNGDLVDRGSNRQAEVCGVARDLLAVFAARR